MPVGKPRGSVSGTPGGLRVRAARMLGRRRGITENGSFTPLLDAKAAGLLLGVPHTWLLAQARMGRIPHHRLEHYVRFNPHDLESWPKDTRQEHDGRTAEEALLRNRVDLHRIRLLVRQVARRTPAGQAPPRPRPRRRRDRRAHAQAGRARPTPGEGRSDASSCPRSGSPSSRPPSATSTTSSTSCSARSRPSRTTGSSPPNTSGRTSTPRRSRRSHPTTSSPTSPPSDTPASP
jgi:hypothetical protein